MCEATTIQEALDLVDALNESGMVDTAIPNLTNPGADTGTEYVNKEILIDGEINRD